MKKLTLASILMISFSMFGSAQEAGNRSYGTQKRVPLANTGVLTGVVEGKPVYFVETNVLANLKPDAFVAVFGLVQEGVTSSESNEKINAQLTGFISDIRAAGVPAEAV